MSDTFRLTFYGTRGSRTVPGAQAGRWGGHTTCLGIRAGSRELIFDAGSGIVPLGESLVRQHMSAAPQEVLRAYLFQTHTHLDHLCGLPYFIPLYLPLTTLWMLGPRTAHLSFQETIERLLHPPFHPVPLFEMPSLIRWGEIAEPTSALFVRGQHDPLLLNLKHPDQRALAPPPEEIEVAVHTLHGYNHPKCGVTIYRVEHAGRAVVFATDVEGYVHGDQRLIRFARGADVLIHDAMYTADRYANPNTPTQGWGHSTVEIAAEVARAADVGHLYLVHHDPGHDDARLAQMETLGQSLFPRTTSAFDGLSIDLLDTPRR